MPNKQIALKVKNITKTFGKTIANKNVSLEVKKGSIHVIAGENGAGKSTLMNLIFGLYKPDKGKIFINGQQVEIKNSKHASDLGIGMVHQHFKLVDIFTAKQNIILGQEPTKGKHEIDEVKAQKLIQKAMKEFNLDIPLDVPVEKLSIGQKQKLEIIKLLYRKSQILIFDEPTAVLTPAEIESLIKTIKEFKKAGKTIIVITHKLDEIKKLADNITVLRHGEVTDSFDRTKLTTSRLTKAIVGKKSISKIVKRNSRPGKILFKLSNVHARKVGFEKSRSLKGVSLEVKEGEIVAIAGVEGNGQKELALIATGMLGILDGQILFLDKDVSKQKAQNRYRQGMSHIPADRTHHGIIMGMSLTNNAAFQDIDIFPYSNGPLINKKSFVKKALDIIKTFDVRGAKNLKKPIGTLSGGNQQKFVVGRELLRKNTKFIVATQPTRGLDIGSTRFIHEQLLNAKKENKGILLISYELPEVIELADRVLVLNSGRIQGELTKNDISTSKIGMLLTKNKKESK